MNITKYWFAGLVCLAIAACSGESKKSVDKPTEKPASSTVAPQAEKPAQKLPGELTIEKYIDAYAAKDLDGYLAILDENLLTGLYPDRIFATARNGVADAAAADFEARPDSHLVLDDRFHIAADKWVTFGRSINGEQVAPILILFDLDQANSKIEATWTKIGYPGFVAGPAVTGPTPGMTGNLQTLLTDLQAGDVGNATDLFSPAAALYTWPPADPSDYRPIISGSFDVASVLAFKWGEGAFRRADTAREDTFISRYMQYVILGIPGGGKAFDRVALLTFGADPEADDFEKITRVDVMGPSGG